MAGTGSSKAVDPIAYRTEEQGPITENTQVWGFEPEKLKNADVNISAYGDDSSEKNYNNPDLWGGENSKYKGENTKNTSVAYNKDATLEGLYPNYAYGQKAQMVNSGDAGYIQRRNDEIASALYNAGKVSPEDVREYLMKQEGFMNSTENERENTIKSVWKRLGEISSSQGKNENASNGDEGVKNMENDLIKNTGGEIYGKNTADSRGEDSAIKTLQDANSIEAKIVQSRINNFKSLQAMDSSSIAASIVSGYTPYGDQGMRDLMQYDPQKYKEVQEYIKKYKGQKEIDVITTGEGDTKSEKELSDEQIKNDKERFADENTTSESEKEELLKSVDEDLASNQSAQTAEDTMNNINKDIEKLKTRLKNLDNEAAKLFKGDVPQYIVNAYKSNRTKEIQDKLSELQSNYNAAYDRYKTQLDNEWKQKEYDLKVKQYDRDYNLQLKKLSLSEQEFELNAYKTRQDIMINNRKLDNANLFTDKNGKTWEKYQDADGNWLIREVPELKTYSGTGMGGAGLRNNNPGNIKDTGFGNVIGTDSRGFAIFATPEDGFDALVAKLTNAVNGGSSTYPNTMTLYDFFAKYAPSEDNNNPKAYAESVAKQLGILPTTQIKDIKDITKWAAAIAKHDSGYNYETYGQFRGNDTSGDGYDYSDSETLKTLADSFLENGKLAKQEWDTIDSIINGDNPRRAWDEYLAKYIEEKYGEQTELERRVDGNEKLFQVLSDDGVTPIAFRQRIYNLVPATLKNSEVELKNLYETAKKLYSAGYTPDEAALVFYGIDLRNDKTGIGYPLIMEARMAGDIPENFYGTIGGYLETNKPEQAIQYVDNVVMGKEADTVDKTTALVAKLENLNTAIDEAETLIGPIGGKVGSFINKWKGDENYATAIAKLTNAFAQVQNELMGSNITEGESKRYEGMIPQMTDKVSTIKTKIKEAQNNAIIDLNAIRKRYSLPELTSESLLDTSKKLELYKEVLGANQGGGNGYTEVIIDIDGGNNDYDDDYDDSDLPI